MMNAHDEVDDRLRQAGVNDDAAVAATKDDEDDTSISVVGNEINNDDDGDENNERLLQEEEDEEKRAAIAAARLRHQQRPEKQRRKLRKVLELAENFPVRQRMKINQLVEDFLASLEEDIHDMVTDQRRAINYQGLNSERDTEAEVETALRIFPNNLRRRKRDESGSNLTLYPIQCLSFKINTDITDGYTIKYRRNIKAVSFTHLFARLAIELKSFEEKERGGLLIRRTESDPDSNVFAWLASDAWPKKHNAMTSKQHEDELYLLEMIRLKKMNLMKKEDILQFGLIERNLRPRSLRFLVEWCPQSLLRVNEWGHLPLHHFVAAGTTSRSILGFQTLFDYCIRYYPKMKGINLLFQQDNWDETPYQDAIQSFGRKKVMDVVEEILTRYANTTPIQTEKAVILAATDDRVHLDSVYFLLRRDPGVLCGSQLLLPTIEAVNDGDGDDNDDVASEHTLIRNNMANDGTNENNNIGADDNGNDENTIDRNSINSDLDLNVDDDNGNSNNNSSSIDDDINGDHPANGRNRKRQRIK